MSRVVEWVNGAGLTQSRREVQWCETHDSARAVSEQHDSYGFCQTWAIVLGVEHWEPTDLLVIDSCEFVRMELRPVGYQTKERTDG